jgi:hypothetical protein
MNLVATSFATQPVCNAAWAAHALRLDQLILVCSHYNTLVVTLQHMAHNTVTSQGLPEQCHFHYKINKTGQCISMTPATQCPVSHHPQCGFHTQVCK